MTFEQNLEKYAELTVKVGVNVQPGQTLVVNAPLAADTFVRKLVQKAYEAGATYVHVEWNDEQVTKARFLYAPDESFDYYPLWKAKGYEEMAEDNAAFISITADDPDLLADVDPDKVAKLRKTSATAMRRFQDFIKASKVSWTVVGVPSPAWAQKIFPDETDVDAVQRLWDKIFTIARVDQDDPIQAWNEHTAQLRQKLEYLNTKKYKALHYSAPGTDLTIELPEKHLWLGGTEVTDKGIVTVPNIPTEEVFTLPHKRGVNGTVRSTKPLNYGGNLIDNFSLTFKEGKVVDFDAEKGYDTLKRMLDIDENACYLGEVALVPHESPISQSNLVFYNTLYDENASSHLALGAAYPICLENGSNMSQEELEQHGANVSITHVDFMIGSDQMDIDGIKEDGAREPLMRNGNWVI